MKIQNVMQYKKIFFVIFFALLIFGVGYIYYKKSTEKIVTFIYWDEIVDELVNKDWYTYMRQKISHYGYKVEVSDKIKNSDFIIWGCPCTLDLMNIDKNAILVGWLQETPLILKQPPHKIMEDRFDRMYTWRKDLVDNNKYFYIPLLNGVKEIDYKLWNEPKKVLVTQVASYVPSSYKYLVKSLYDERSIATKWFLYNAPNDFKLYGKKWDDLKLDIPEKYHDAFDNMYEGFIKDKYKATSQSKFVLAYENAIHNDYVSEKIYDVLQSGSVPIYYGAPNISDYVPKECFIDRRDFADYKELYTFLKNMTDETYESYRKCAYDFIQTQRKQHEKVIDILVDGIFNDLLKKKKPLADKH